MARSADLPTHVAMKYGGSNMADNHKSGTFGILTMNYGLFIEVAEILRLQCEIIYAELLNGPQNLPGQPCCNEKWQIEHGPSDGWAVY